MTWDTPLWNPPLPDPNYKANQFARTAIFNLIANAQNWKLPVDAWIERDRFEDCEQAALFFIGGGLKITGERGTQVRVQAPGYYATIGA